VWDANQLMATLARLLPPLFEIRQVEVPQHARKNHAPDIVPVAVPRAADFVVMYHGRSAVTDQQMKRWELTGEGAGRPADVGGCDAHSERGFPPRVSASFACGCCCSHKLLQ
jgi:hypothetical protein